MLTNVIFDSKNAKKKYCWYCGHCENITMNIRGEKNTREH